MDLTVNPVASTGRSQVANSTESFKFYNTASLVSQIGLKIIAIAALTVLALPLSFVIEPFLEVINLTPLGKKLPKPLQGTNAIFQIFIGLGSEIFDKIEGLFPIKKPRHIPNSLTPSSAKSP